MTLLHGIHICLSPASSLNSLTLFGAANLFYEPNLLINFDMQTIKKKKKCIFILNEWMGGNGYCSNKVISKLTKCPDKVVLWPQCQHGKVQVDDLKIERCGADKVIVYGVLHGEQLAQRQIDGQRDGTRAQLGDDVILGGGEGREWDTKNQSCSNPLLCIIFKKEQEPHYET